MSRHPLGRDYLVAPLETLPKVAALLARNNPVETDYVMARREPSITGCPIWIWSTGDQHCLA